MIVVVVVVIGVTMEFDIEALFEIGHCRLKKRLFFPLLPIAISIIIFVIAIVDVFDLVIIRSSYHCRMFAIDSVQVASAVTVTIAVTTSVTPGQSHGGTILPVVVVFQRQCLLVVHPNVDIVAAKAATTQPRSQRVSRRLPFVDGDAAAAHSTANSNRSRRRGGGTALVVAITVAVAVLEEREQCRGARGVDGRGGAPSGEKRLVVSFRRRIVASLVDGGQGAEERLVSVHAECYVHRFARRDENNNIMTIKNNTMWLSNFSNTYYFVDDESFRSSRSKLSLVVGSSVLTNFNCQE